MFKSLQYIIAFSVPLLLSCEKTITADQVDSVYKEQNRLIKEMQDRHQISDVKEEKGIWTIDFKHGNKVHLFESVFPAIQVDQANRWVISGFPTGVEVRKDENGSLLLPVLSYGEDGFWALDECHTDFPIEEYQNFLIQEGKETLNLTGLLSFEDKLYFYMSDNTVHKYSVIKDGFYLVPDYWMETLVEKERMAEEAIAEADGDCTTFVFITDVHWGKNMKKSPALIRHIIDFTPFDDVLCGGDIVTFNYTNLVTPMEQGKDFQASFAFLGTRFHCLFGNHDDNSDSQVNKTEYHLSEEQVYSWLQSQMTDVVYGDYYYYYYDNPLTKTRMICLDTGRYNYPQFRDKLPYTVSFAIESLNTLPEGWHAIMASHLWCNSKKQSDGSYTYFLDSFIKPILKVFDDYNTRLSGIYKYDNREIPYDFSSAGGKIEYCIGGHTHNNYIEYSEGGIPVIIVMSDYALNPQPGTNKEQSVTMVVTDYKNKKINMFAVGRGSDRSFDL